MRLPKKIKVGCYTYKICMVKDVAKKYHENDTAKGNTEYYGYCDNEKMKIYLQTRMANDMKREVFLHEVLHSIEHAYGFSVSDKSINNMALGLAGVIRNNKLNFL